MSDPIGRIIRGYYKPDVDNIVKKYYQEEEIPGASDIVREELSKKGVNPLISSILTSPIKIGEFALDVVGEPSKTIESVGKAAGELLNIGKSVIEHPSTIPSIAGNLIWEGIIRPLTLAPIESATGRSLRSDTFFDKLSEQDRLRLGDEFSGSLAGFIVGSAIGKSLRYSNLNSTVRKLSNVKSVDDLIANMDNIDPFTKLTIAENLTDPTFVSKSIKGFTEGALGGIVTGAITGQTKEERFNNAFNYGLAGSVLGTVFELFHKNPYGGLDDKLRTASYDHQVRLIMSLPADKAISVVKKVNGDDIAAGIIKNGGLFRGTYGDPIILTDIKLNKNKHSFIFEDNNIIKYKQPDGKYSIILPTYIDPKDTVLGTAITNGFSLRPENIIKNSDDPLVLYKASATPNVSDIPESAFDKAGFSTLFDDPEVAQKGFLSNDEYALFSEVLKNRLKAVEQEIVSSDPELKSRLESEKAEINKTLEDMQNRQFVEKFYVKSSNPLIGIIRIDTPEGSNLLKLFTDRVKASIAPNNIKEQLIDFVDNKLPVDIVTEDIANIGQVITRFIDFTNKTVGDQYLGRSIVVSFLQENGYDSFINISATDTGRLYTTVLPITEDRMVNAYGLIKPEILKKENIKKIRRQFQTYGLIKGQAVSYNGYEYIVESPGNTRVKLRNPMDNSIVIANRKDVKIVYNKKTADLGIPSTSVSDFLKNYMDPDEYANLQMLLNMSAPYVPSTTSKVAIDLVTQANNAGFIVDKSAGKIILKSRFNGSIIGPFDNIKDVTDKISSLPPPGFVVEPPPSIPNPPIPPVGGTFSYGGNSPSKRLANVFNLLRIQLNILSSSYFVFKAINDFYPDSMILKRFIDLQDALTKFDAARNPDLKKLKAIADKAQGLTKDQREIVFDYIETMTPDEIKKNLMSRPMNAEEIRIAEEMAGKLRGDNNLDNGIIKVQKYLLYERILRDSDLSKKAIAKKLNEFESAMGGFTNAEKELLVIMKAKARNKPEEWSPYAVTRLISAILLDSKDRATFASINNMTKQQLELANSIEALFKDLADKFGIDDVRRINGYISHIKRYGEDIDLTKSSLYNILKPVDREFFAEKMRTGKITELTKDPIDIALRYINAGYRDRHLNDALKAFENEAISTANIAKSDIKSPLGRRYGEALLKYYKSFLDSVSGSTTDGEVIAEGAFKRFHKLAFPNIGDKDRAGFLASLFGLINPFRATTLIKNIEFAAQGFKPIAGYRDATTFSLIFGVRFGIKEFSNAIKLWRKAVEDGTVAKLIESGEIPGLSITIVESSEEQLARELIEGITSPGVKGKTLQTVAKIGNAFDKVREVGFKASLQPWVYNNVHAISYLWAYDRTLNAINKFKSGAISETKFADMIDLHSYSDSIQKTFTDMVDNGKYVDAAKYLAKVTGYELVGRYGHANSPKLMWGRYGKVLGQFSTWPSWFMNVFADLISQGSTKDIAKRVAAMAAIMYALKVTQEETGWDLTSWDLDPQNAISFRGSPVLEFLLEIGRASDEQGPERAFAINEIKRALDPTGRTVFVPRPLELLNIIEAVERWENGDPFHVVGWRLLGGTIDKDLFPRP